MNGQHDIFLYQTLESVRGTIWSPCCETAQEAEQIADNAAARLGLKKQPLEESRTFSYQDVTRNVQLEVRIFYTNYHGPQNCWAFACSAGRVGDSLNISPEHSYRKIPSLFDEDAISIVRLVLAGEVERRKRLAEKIAALQKTRPDRLVGTLKVWLQKKQYGFLQYTFTPPAIDNVKVLFPSGPAAIFLHVREVKTHNRQHLQIGQIFSFKRECGAKGWRAVEAVPLF